MLDRAQHNIDASRVSNPWFMVPSPRPQASLRLFCFAYAGGNANIFRSWADQLDEQIELIAIQLPGRGARFNEPLLDSMESILEQLRLVFKDQYHRPYAFFGHSMGASIAFELSRIIQQRAKTDSDVLLPSRLIVSGRKGPSFVEEQEREPIHNLPKEEFINRLKNLNGTPQELLEHEDLMALMEPILRSDFKVIETWQHQEGELLKIPMSVYSGDEDEYLCPESLKAWQKETDQKCEFVSFSGDHFYLQSQEQNLVNQINKSLAT